MTTPDFAPTDPEQEEWDVIVVGTGMGGSTIGHALAKNGHKVLFLEKGMFLFGDHDRGQGTQSVIDNNPETRLRHGLWPLPIEGKRDEVDMKFFAPLGCGTGGTTSRYAAQLERFMPCDFAPRANYPEDTGSTLPDTWPVSYEDLVPYYRTAEKLFRVCGTPDPLNPDIGSRLREPPPLSPRDHDLKDSFEELGLHPFRSHVGCRFIDGCLDCTGLCPYDCRSDAGRVCLLPALQTHGARLLIKCEVVRLEADETRVRRVHCRRDGETLVLRGRIVILAAGSFMTPILLLNSDSRLWPAGLANRSGLVGRNLMMHGGDVIAIRPRQQLPQEGPGKTLVFNDLYFSEGNKLGTIQSVGHKINVGDVLQFLRDVVDRNPRQGLQLIRPFLRLIAPLGAFYYRNAAVFATIIEDLPYYHNRVLVDPGSSNGMRFEYEYPRELVQRNELFRSRLRRILAPHHRMSILTNERWLNYGHSCGTCRFGNEAETSVLDHTNRAHDLENLFIVDASFFPSSGGTNPSLTIAANALRVADVIGKRS